MFAKNGPSNGQPERQDRGPVRVDLGRLCATPGALDAIDQATVLASLRRHVTGDWGNIDAEDKAANDQALLSGGRLVSSYLGKDGTKFWVITEADRSSTTVLLPEEY